MTTKKIIIITTILTISAISGCFWYVQTVKEQRNNIVNNDENLEAKENIWDANISTPSIEEEMDISNWQTYRNEEYGFEIKYPADWNISSITEKDVWINNPKKGYMIEGSVEDPILISIFPDCQSNLPQLLQVWNAKYNISITKKNNDLGVVYYYAGYGNGAIVCLNEKSYAISISSSVMTTPEIEKELQPVLYAMIKSIKNSKH